MLIKGNFKSVGVRESELKDALEKRWSEGLKKEVGEAEEKLLAVPCFRLRKTVTVHCIHCCVDTLFMVMFVQVYEVGLYKLLQVSCACVSLERVSILRNYTNIFECRVHVWKHSEV